MPSAGKRVAGRYCLEAPLGKGGMGCVWRARHLELDVPVAVKFQHHLGPHPARAVARFRREARAAAKTANPHVVRVIDFGVDQNVPYLVMELLQGESLKARLARGDAISIDEVVELTRQAASALDAVHEQGIVHRDVKPSNLFLVRDADRELLKLLDFGIAKWFDTGEATAATSTASGVVLGSVYYMSPEQARAEEDVDHRSDVWSLGVVVYELLTGLPPFQGANLPDTLQRICSGSFAKPSSVCGTDLRSLDAVFERAFAVERAARFSSASEFASAFIDATRGAPGVRPLPPVRNPDGWSFGREGTTKSARPDPSRRAPWRRRALGIGSAVAALGVAVAALLAPSASRNHSPASAASAPPAATHSMPDDPIQALAPRTEERQALQARASKGHAPAMAASSSSQTATRPAGRPARAPERPAAQDSKRASIRNQEVDHVARVDPVFGLLVRGAP